MRGLMIGFFFFIWGFSDTIATTILTLFSLRRVGPPESCNFWYHIILLVIGVIAFVVYLIVARCYRNRKRPISNENYVYYNLMKWIPVLFQILYKSVVWRLHVVTITILYLNKTYIYIIVYINNNIIITTILVLGCMYYYESLFFSLLFFTSCSAFHYCQLYYNNYY